MRGDLSRRALWVVLALGLGGAGFRNDEGVFPQARPPATLSTSQSVRWRVPLSGWSNASPVLVGGRVCVMTEPTTLTCRDAATGAASWSATNTVLDTLSGPERERVAAHLTEVEVLKPLTAQLLAEQSGLRRAMRSSDDPAIPARLSALSAQLVDLDKLRATWAAYLTPPDRESVGYTMPTPWTDGRTLWVQVGNGVISRFEADGRRVWSIWLGPGTSSFRGWDFPGPTASASPRMVDGLLIVAHNGLVALDPASGVVRWRVEGYADFGTPAVARVGSDAVLVTPDGRAVRARDGRVLATQLGSTYFVGPVASGDRVIYAGGEALGGRASFAATALRLVPAGPDSVRAEPLWTTPLVPSARVFASPVWVDGRLWVVQESGDLTVLEASTGAKLASAKLPQGAQKGLYGSMVAAGGQVWFGAQSGELVRARLGTAGTIDLTVTPVEPMRSAPSFAGDVVYLRTLTALWAFGP